VVVVVVGGSVVVGGGSVVVVGGATGAGGTVLGTADWVTSAVVSAGVEPPLIRSAASCQAGK